MSSNEEIEQEIIDKGLTAPRVTQEQINTKIVNADYHVFEGSQLTVCSLTLENGFTVTGESACASPENFDAVLRRRIALRKATDKVWALEGYLLKQKLFEKGSDNYISRLKNELLELNEKITKLGAFIDSANFVEQVSKNERVMLQQQYVFMLEYDVILTNRLKLVQ